MRLVPARKRNPGDKASYISEERIGELVFRVHKFGPRPRPSVPNVAIFPHFCEFGSEFVASMYCLPFLLNGRLQGKYSVVMGWHGRAYLYKHLVDEFWELAEEHMWLRESSRAFHHDSVNLRRAEKAARQHGVVVNTSMEYGIMAVYERLRACTSAGCGGRVGMRTDGRQRCEKCGTLYPPPGFYRYVNDMKERAVWVPRPSQAKLDLVEPLLGPNPVGVTGRNRKCYGRNLDADFYRKLLLRLEAAGYTPVWLGEPATSLPCPVDHVYDFSRSPMAGDLEITLALVSKLKFTVQFWTASTRLAGVTGVPFLLFESPGQIYGPEGQEGFRMSLCTRGPKKLVLAHYKNVVENQDAGLDLVFKAVSEMERGNYDNLVGLVENEAVVHQISQLNAKRVGVSP